MGVDGKLGITIPLKKWSHGMFGDFDITVAFASALFRKTSDEIGLYVSVAAGGFANNNMMADIQRKILDKFQSPPVKAVVGLLGKGIGAVVDILTSVGVNFSFTSRGNAKMEGVNPASDLGNHEVFLQHKDDKMAFCFAIKGIYDSCGNGFENLLLLLQAGARMVVKVGKVIADAAEGTFNAATKEVAELSEASLQHGKVVVEKIGKNFENAAKATRDFFEGQGEVAIEMAGEAKDRLEGGAKATGNVAEQGANSVANTVEAGYNGAKNTVSSAAHKIFRVFR